MSHVRRAIALVIVLLAATPAFPRYLGGLMATPGSVRIHGFANAGVACPAPGSQTINPGTLALISDGRYLSLAMYPTRAGLEDYSEYGYRYYGFAVGLPLQHRDGDERLSAGFAYAYHRFDYQHIVLPAPTRSPDPRDEAHNLTAAVAYRGTIRAGFGVTARYYRSINPLWNTSSTSSSTMFDFGGTVSRTFGNDPHQSVVSSTLKWSFTPTVGLSVRNVGPNLQYAGSNPDDPPAKKVRAGLAIGLKRWLGDIVAYSFTPMFEYEKLLVEQKSQYYHYAGEIGIAEIAYFRYGKVTANYSSLDQTAWGLTITTRGLAPLLKDSYPTFLRKAEFEINYAKYSRDGSYLEGLRFMEIGASYRF